MAIEKLDKFEGVDTVADMTMFWNDYNSFIAEINIVLNIFMLLSFIGVGYGLYVLAKKMNIKNAWMGWVPLLNYYMMTQIAGVSFIKYIIIPILVYLGIVIVGVIVGGVLMSLGGGFYTYMIIGGIGILGSYIYMILKYIQILSATSKRTGRGGWTTAGLFFIPFIMYPIVALKYKKENKSEESKKEVKNTAKIEL